MSKDTDINFLKIQTCVLKIHIHYDGCRGKDQKAPLMPQQLSLQEQQQLLQQMKGFPQLKDMKLPQLKDMKLPQLKDMKMPPPKDQKNVKFSLPPADEFDDEGSDFDDE